MQESKPAAIQHLDRQLIRRRIELEALRKETDQASLERRDALQGEVVSMEAKMQELERSWQEERTRLGRAKQAKEELEEARREMDLATRRGEWSRVSQLKYDVIPRLQRESEAQGGEAGSMVANAVTPALVASVVSRTTGIPLEALVTSEKQRLLHMEDELAKRVVGQPHVRAAHLGGRAPSRAAR